MRTLLVILLAGAASPAIAQGSGQTTQPATPPAATCTPEHAAMGHCTLPAKEPNPQSSAAPSLNNQPACTAEHAAMGHCALPATELKPQPAAPLSQKDQPDCTAEHAAMGHCTLPETTPPASAPDPHAQHQQPTKTQPSCTPEHAAMRHCSLLGSPQGEIRSSNPHAGHTVTAIEPPVAPPPAAALSGPEHAADVVYGVAEMAPSREVLRKEHGDMSVSRVFFDRIETSAGKGADEYLVEGQAWLGGDINKLWLKTELEGEWGHGIEIAEVQALWSHAIDPWFDLQTGIRFDPQPGPNRTHLALGIQGLAPYWWEVDGTVFLSSKGEVTARAEAEYDLRITQKLILQPRIEAELSAQKIDELGIGAGLTEGSLGFRLRYQISPLVAPYVGLEYERAFGDTGDFRRADGDSRGGLNFVAGLRIWL